MRPNRIQEARISKVRALMAQRGLDTLLIHVLPHIYYLTGFTGSNALCVLTRTASLFLTDSRYREQSRLEVSGFRRIITSGVLFEEAARHTMVRTSRSVGFESEHLSHDLYRKLRGQLRRITLVPVTGMLEDLMVVKDDSEVACIQEAVKITDRVFLDLLPLIRPGVTEHTLAAEISYRHRLYGADRDAFDAIVASGVRGALPHARATTKSVKRGEYVTLDFGCVVRGYASDLTRTVFVGRPTRRAKEIYAVVKEAQEEAVQAARGGMLARDLDAVARRRIRSSGYGRYFSHSLGHGLGLHVHERPRVSRLSSERLRSGSVITIEPGVYIPGFGGVRIEDDVLLHDQGCRVLNASSKELIAL